MMLQALAIPKNAIKALSTAQKQTQFDYVKQRIFEQTGEIWKWDGAPKDGEWIRVNDATIEAPIVENPLPDETLSDAIVATDKEKAYTLVQVNLSKAHAKLEEVGLSGDPKSGKEFAAMFPDYFEYDTKNTKLSYKKPKTQS